MGHELRRMIRDGAPPAWNSEMRLVAMEIADDARDPDRAGAVAEPPWSALRVTGRWERGRWRDGLAERTGLSGRAISRALTMLAEAGYEMRVEIGKTKGGKPLFAAKGHATRFVVPPLRPRPEPQRPPKVAPLEPLRPPQPASFNGDCEGQRSPLMASKGAISGGLRPPKPATYGDPISSVKNPLIDPLTAEAKSGSPPDVEGTPAGTREQDQFFQPSFLLPVQGQAAPAGRPSRWRDPQETAQKQVAEARRRRAGREGKVS